MDAGVHGWMRECVEGEEKKASQIKLSARLSCR